MFASLSATAHLEHINVTPPPRDVGPGFVLFSEPKMGLTPRVIQFALNISPSPRFVLPAPLQDDTTRTTPVL